MEYPLDTEIRITTVVPVEELVDIICDQGNEVIMASVDELLARMDCGDTYRRWKRGLK